MFSQKIAGLVCLAELGRETDAKGLEVLQLRWIFRRSLSAFQKGDPTLGIPKESNRDILNRLDDLKEVWKIKADAMDNWAMSDATAAPKVYKLSQQVLKSTEAAIKDMQQHYLGKELVTKPTLLAISNVGRLRMLSQRVVNEFCLIHSKVEPDDNKSKLKISISDFESAMIALTNGSAETGLEKPPAMIQDQLAKTAREFNILKNTLAKALAGKPITEADLDIVEQQSTKVLLAADETIYVYEQLK